MISGQLSAQWYYYLFILSFHTLADTHPMEQPAHSQLMSLLLPFHPPVPGSATVGHLGTHSYTARERKGGVR